MTFFMKVKKLHNSNLFIKINFTFLSRHISASWYLGKSAVLLERHFSSLREKYKQTQYEFSTVNQLRNFDYSYQRGHSHNCHQTLQLI